MAGAAAPSLRLTRRASAPLARRLVIPCGRTRLVYQGRPLIMGILNVTPDSFSDGGRFAEVQDAVSRGLVMAQEGADLIDVGGESTRPQAHPVPPEEEVQRVVPVIAALAKAVRIPISIDTSKAVVAAHAMEAGASIINDVTGLAGDRDMPAVAARTRAAVILMHMRGTPRTMQRAPRYADVTADVAAYLRGAAAKAVRAGIARERILIDPGLGFGKTLRHNLELMRSLGRFIALGYPVVLGPSKKGFIGATVDATVDERLAGTLACVAEAWRAGVHMVRVHDVRPARDVVRMLEAIAHG